MTDFSMRWVKKSRQHGECLHRLRGHVLVEHDGFMWLYRVKRGELRDFKSWLHAVFNFRAVTGKYPHYDIN